MDKLNKSFHSHNSHGSAVPGRTPGHVRGDIARNGAGKDTYSVKIHGGMVRTALTGDRALGGDHASAIDSLTGGIVVPGARNVSTPGYGNGGVQSGHPLAKAPGTKNLKPVDVHPSMAHRAAPSMHSLGNAILEQAYSVAGGDHPVNLERALRTKPPDSNSEK